MSERKHIKKIAKLQYKAGKFRAKAKMFKDKNKFKKAGKLEGKAQQ